MKINSVNFVNYHNKSYSFNGLWGKTSVKTDVDEVMNIPIHEYSYYYYPFADESEKSIEKMRTKIENASIVTENNKPKYYINDFKQCISLPFTEEKYLEYKTVLNPETLSDEKIAEYTDMQKRIKTKFATYEYDRQISAVNNVLAEYLSLNQHSGHAS